jgi:hypothetical protein
LDDPATGFLKIKDKAAAPEAKPFAQRIDNARGMGHVSAGE